MCPDTDYVSQMNDHDDDHDHDHAYDSPKNSYQRKLKEIFLKGGEKLVKLFKEKEAHRKSIQRLSMTEDQRHNYNEKAKFRQRRFR